MPLAPELLVRLAVVEGPELVPGVVRTTRTQPLPPAQQRDARLDLAIPRDEGAVRARPRPPHPDAHEHLARAERVEAPARARLVRALHRTQPQRIDAQRGVRVGEELRRARRRHRQVLDDILTGQPARVQGVVQDARAHEPVQQAARERRARDAEVGEGVAARPEGAAVVAEQVVGERRGVGAVGGRALGVQVEPRVVGAREADDGAARAAVVAAPRDDDAARGAVEDGVEVVDGRVGALGGERLEGFLRRGHGVIGELDPEGAWDQAQLQQRRDAEGAEAGGGAEEEVRVRVRGRGQHVAVGEDDLDAQHRPVEEAVPEGG